MTVGELITELNKYPQDTKVFVFDWRKNLGDDCGDGSSAGIYQLNLDYENLDKEEVDYLKETYDEDFKPWLGISFENSDYTDDGTCLLIEE